MSSHLVPILLGDSKIPFADANFNFAGNSYGALNVTRASTGYASTTAGVWSSFSSNTARVTDQGILIEGARTNSIRNNIGSAAVGYTTVSPQTVSSLSRSGTSTATMITGSAHGLVSNDVITVSGASVSDYNGNFVITKVDATTLTYVTGNRTGTDTPTGASYTAIHAGTTPTNWFTGAVNGIYPMVAGTGTMNGMDYIDFRYIGTATATSNTGPTFENNTSIASVQGDVWSMSYYYALAAGSKNTSFFIRQGVSEYNGAAFVSQQLGTSSPTITSSWSRITATFTVASASTTNVRPFANVGFTVNENLDFVVRIGWPQAELGSFVTSPIRTSGAATARAADVVYALIPNSVKNQHTLFVAGIGMAPSAYGTNQISAFLTDAAKNNYTSFAKNNTSSASSIFIEAGGAGGYIGGDTIAWTPNVIGKQAISVTAGIQNTAFNGSFKAFSTAAIGTGMDRVYIGSDGAGAQFWYGYITKISIWSNQALSSRAVVALTS